jgi:hypothetical protein
LGAFPAQSRKQGKCAGNRAFRSNSSKTPEVFSAGFPLQSLARGSTLRVERAKPLRGFVVEMGGGSGKAFLRKQKPLERGL